MQAVTLQSKIYDIRGQKVILDLDLAILYEIETKVLNQSVKRNVKRFPVDFMFQLSDDEYNSLRSQFVILENVGRGKYSKYLPFAFTEQGVAMLSGILNSDGNKCKYCHNANFCYDKKICFGTQRIQC